MKTIRLLGIVLLVMSAAEGVPGARPIAGSHNGNLAVDPVDLARTTEPLIFITPDGRVLSPLPKGADGNVSNASRALHVATTEWLGKPENLKRLGEAKATWFGDYRRQRIAETGTPLVQYVNDRLALWLNSYESTARRRTTAADLIKKNVARFQSTVTPQGGGCPPNSICEDAIQCCVDGTCHFCDCWAPCDGCCTFETPGPGSKTGIGVDR